MREKFLLEIVDNKRYFVISILISFLTLLPQFFFSPFFLHTLFLVFALLWLISIAKFSRVLFALFVLFINGMNIIVGHVAMHWGYANADLSPRFETMAISPKYEMFEYLQSYIDLRDVVLILYSIMVMGILFYYLKHYRHTYSVVRKFGIGVFVLLLIAYSPYHDHVEKPEPFSILGKYFKAVENSMFKELIMKRKMYLHKNPIIKKDINTPYDKVVIVLGESVNKNHMGVYGYQYATTPYFTSLYKDHKIWRFDAIAPSNQTMYSVPILFTDANVHDFNEAFTHSRSLMGLYKAAGYKTYWISNQGRRGDNAVVAVAEEAEVSTFVNQGYYMDVAPDQTVVDALNKLKKSNTKELYVLHLIGSHGAYNKRYTKEISLFKNPSDLFEEYDNTIYYTDHILKEIMDYFKGENLLLVYVSDHAELISKDQNGHGFLPAFKDEYEVPLFIYSSKQNSRIEAIHRQNMQHYFNTENFNKMLTYISALESDLNISTSSDVIMVNPKNIADYESLKSYAP